MIADLNYKTARKAANQRTIRQMPRAGNVKPNLINGAMFLPINDLSLDLCGYDPHRLCLVASYNTILAATPAFSDSTLGECGMDTTSSIALMRSRDNPAPSLPIKMTIGPERLA